MNDNWRPPFFTVWSGQAFSRLGSRIVSFAIIWWLTESTGSAGVLATATMMTLLPPVFLGPYAGALVDRWDRRKVMLVSDSMIAVFTAVLAFLFFRDIAQPWHIYGIILVRALGETFHAPSMKASTTLMVPNEYLSKVGGMNQTLGGILGIAAPPTGALVLRLLPMHSVLMIDVITAAAAVIPLIFIAIPQPNRDNMDRKPGASFRDMVDGLKYLVNAKTLFFIVFTCTCANLFIGPIQSFLPLLITREFGGGAVELGIATSAASIGIIIGGLVMSAWGGLKRKLATSAIGWIGVGIPLAAVLFIPGDSFWIFVVVRVLVGIAIPIGSAPLEAWYQSVVPADKQGRVFAVLTSVDRLSMPFGLAIGGALSSVVPLRFWWALVGISHAVLGLAWLLVPRVKRAES